MTDNKLTEEQMQFRQEVRESFADCDMRFAEGSRKFDAFLTSQKENTEAITLLIGETREVVQLHRDIQGVTRIGKRVQAFGKWILTWPLIGAGVYTAYVWIIEQLTK